MPVTESQPLLDEHAEQSAGSETGGIGQQVPGVVEVAEDDGDGRHPDGGLA